MKLFKILFFLFTGSFTYSQDESALSLADAIKIALENNYSIKIANDQTAITRNNNSWGEAGRYPSIDIQINQNNNINDQSNNPTSFIQEKLITNSLSGNVGLNWTLFSGFRVSITKDRLELLQAQSEGNALLVVENTIHSVILAYYNVVLQKEKLDVLKKLIRLSRDKYDYEMMKKNVGVGTTFEMLQIKNAFLTDSTNYLLQDLNHKNAMRNLNLLMSSDVDKEYVMSDYLQTINDNFNVDSLYTKMLSSNVNVLNQFINIELQKNNIELQKAALYPSLNFALGTMYSANRFQIADQAATGNTINYYGNFTLNFNLFNGGRTKRAIQNARINERIAETSYDQQVFALTNELYNAYDLYTARQKILDLTFEAYETADYNLRLANERLSQGNINSFDYRDVQLAFLNSAMMRLEAAYNLLVSHTDLMRLTGQIVQM